MTFFKDIYKVFLSKITDDMYVSLDKKDTIFLLQEMLLNALDNFVYPKFPINKYEVLDPSFFDSYVKIADHEVLVRDITDDSYFLADLESIEKKIIAELMVVEWTKQQVANVDLTIQLHSGSDAKISSQANQIAKLQDLQKQFQNIAEVSQFNYSKSEEDSKGYRVSTFNSINGFNHKSESRDDFYEYKKF